MISTPLIASVMCKTKFEQIFGEHNMISTPLIASVMCKTRFEQIFGERAK